MQSALNFNVKIHICNDHLNNFNCNCPSIQKVNSTKYLGVLVDQRLSWHPHIELMMNRIRKLIWIFKNLRHITSKKLLNQIYIALVQSVLIYCIPIWGGAIKTKFMEIERAQRSVIKVMYHKPYRFSTEKLYTISGLLTVRKLYIGTADSS